MLIILCNVCTFQIGHLFYFWKKKTSFPWTDNGMQTCAVYPALQWEKVKCQLNDFYPHTHHGFRNSLTDGILKREIGHYNTLQYRIYTYIYIYIFTNSQILCSLWPPQCAVCFFLNNIYRFQKDQLTLATSSLPAANLCCMSFPSLPPLASCHLSTVTILWKGIKMPKNNLPLWKMY